MEKIDKTDLDAGELKILRMTTEPVEKLISRLAVPTIISMLVTSFYNLADTFFVRQLENDSMVAAVGVVLPLMTLIQACGLFCGHGSGNYISRAYGRRDFKDAEIMAATGFFYALGLGLVIMTLGLLFKNTAAIILGAKTEATLKYTRDYMSYILIAAPFMTTAIVLNNQLRLHGNAFFAMIGLTSGAVINMVLDPLLIYKAGDTLFSGSFVMPFGAGMGVAGAALATGISQAVSFVLLFLGMRRSDNVKIHLKNFSFRFFYVRNIVKGGLPSLARQLLGGFASAALNHSVGIFVDGDGLIDAAQAAMTAVSKIMMFFSSALIGFGQGFQPVCGFNFGAKRYDRVRKAYFFCVRTALVALTIIAAIGFIFAGPITSAVAGTSPEAARIAQFTFRAQLVVLPLTAWVVMSNMMLQTIGFTVQATLLAMARQGLTFIPAILLLPVVFSAMGRDPLTGIQIAQSVADILALIISIPITRSVLRRMKDNDPSLSKD